VKFISEKLGRFPLLNRTKRTKHLQVLGGSNQLDMLNRILAADFHLWF